MRAPRAHWALLLVGLLAVYLPRGRDLEPNEAALLSALAAQLAVAAQNAELHERTERQEHEIIVRTYASGSYAHVENVLHRLRSLERQMSHAQAVDVLHAQVMNDPLNGQVLPLTGEVVA